MAVLVVGAVAALTACGSGRDATLTEAAPPTTTTVDAPTTTFPPSTTSPTAPTATSPTPSESSTPGADRAHAEAAFRLYHAGFVGCLAIPANCHPNEFAVPGGRVDQNLSASIREFAGKNLRGEADPVRDRIVITKFSAEPPSLFLTVCEVDGGRQYDTHGTEESSDDTLVNDQVTSITSEWRVVSSSVGWRVADGIRLNEQAGDTCPAG